ncbi:unnamed protein product [Musa hybrid cultivar]
MRDDKVRLLLRSLSCLSDFDLPSSAPPPRDPWPLAPFPFLRCPPKPIPPPCPSQPSPISIAVASSRALTSALGRFASERHGAATHQVCHAVVVSTLLLIFLSIYSACVEKILTFCNVV